MFPMLKITFPHNFQVSMIACLLLQRRIPDNSPHLLQEDVRESLYDECNHWMRSLKKKGTPFMGGSSPNLADLAVFGVLSAISGCEAFQV